MNENTAHRQIVYRLLPERRANWRWLERTLEAQRQLYNAALQERIDAYRKIGKSITLYDQQKSLTECRAALPGMAAVSIRIQRGTLKRLDDAYRRSSGDAAASPGFRDAGTSTASRLSMA